MINKFFYFTMSPKNNYVNRHKDYFAWDPHSKMFIQAMPFDVHAWVNKREERVSLQRKNSKSKYGTE